MVFFFSTTHMIKSPEEHTQSDLFFTFGFCLFWTKCYFSAWRTPAAGNLLTMTTDIGKRWQLQITNCVYYCTNKCQFNTFIHKSTHTIKKNYFDFMQTCALHCKCWYIVVGSYWINQFKKNFFFRKTRMRNRITRTMLCSPITKLHILLPI